MSWMIEKFDDNGDLLDIVFRYDDVWIQFLGSLAFEGRKSRFIGIHIQGPGANRLGMRRILELRDFVKATIDVDELYIEGALRTTGANPYRRPFPHIL